MAVAVPGLALGDYIAGNVCSILAGCNQTPPSLMRPNFNGKLVYLYPNKEQNPFGVCSNKTSRPLHLPRDPPPPIYGHSTACRLRLIGDLQWRFVWSELTSEQD